ncbi:MAG: hypothetical protein AAF423_05560 [Pseudomonadota bacterium]
MLAYIGCPVWVVIGNLLAQLQKILNEVLNSYPSGMPEHTDEQITAIFDALYFRWEP